MAPDCNSVEFDCSKLPSKSVTVYTDRAQVKRLIKLNVKTGEHKVVIRNFPKTMDASSVRVDGRCCDENVTFQIGDVEQAEKHVEKKKEVKNVKTAEMQNKLREIKNKKHKVKDQILIVEQKKEVLEGVANQVREGNINEQLDEKLSSEKSMQNLEKFMLFYISRLAALTSERRKLYDEKINLYEEKLVLEKNLNEPKEKGTGDTNSSREVLTITLDVWSSGSIELFVTYMVCSGSWSPSYDIRVTGENQSMKVYYYGQVQQNSGEDWSETQLSLSTAQPSVGAEVPELKTLMVKIKQPEFVPPPTQIHDPQYQTLAGIDDNKAFGGSNNEPPPLPPMKVVETKVEENALSATFHVPRACTIPSDKTMHKVTIAVIELCPSLEYHCVPSKSELTYLVAKVTNSSKYAFVAGPASIYHDNNFISTTTLTPVSSQEEFTCSLGVDPSIRLEYKPGVVLFKSLRQCCTKKTTETHQQHINIKNTRTNDVTLKLIEQVPLSEEQKLKVSVIKPDMDKEAKEYKINKDNNLEWDLKINAGQNIDVEVKWKLQYPKKKKIVLEEETEV